MKPKVSCIIPTYGGEKTIIRAIDSVLSQNYSNFEVIVVDDNNPDTAERKRTEQYLSKYRDDSRVKYIKHEKNKNGSAARNTGFRNSSGTYICLLDDDDIFLQNKLKKQVEFLELNKEYGACYCWRQRNGLVTKCDQEGDLTKSLLDLSFTPTTCSLMIRRECYLELNGFDETYRRHQDFEFMIRFYKKYQIGVVKEVLIELIGNGVNNEPRGERLYEIKKHFFDQFGCEVERLNKEYPGYRKEVYAQHFARTFKTMIRYRNYGLAVKTYFRYGIKGGLKFWEVFFICCLGGIKERVKRR